MVVPAGFAVNIPVAVRNIIIVEKIFTAIGTLFQSFPAFRAKMEFAEYFELFRCFANVAGTHVCLRVFWILHIEAKREFQYAPGPSKIFFCSKGLFMTGGSFEERFEKK